jgi:ATP-binding cassette subfamily F protein 3
MLLAPSNFLLLDEPTNHLDMRAKDVLLDALSKYNGTVVLVSHDRYFIDNLATRIFEIEDGHVHVYPGNYEDYQWRKQGGPETLAQSNVQAVAAPPANRDSNGTGKRVNPMKLQKVRDRLAAVEKQVAALESEIAAHEAALADFKSVEETVRLNELVTARRRELETRVAEWESLSADLETGV